MGLVREIDAQDGEFAARVQRKMLENVTRGGLLRVMGFNISGLLCVVILLYGHIDSLRLATWLVALVATIATRQVIHRAWQRVRRLSAQALRAWEWLLAASAIFDGSVWAVLLVLIYQSGGRLAPETTILVSAVAVGRLFVHRYSRLNGPLYLLPIIATQALILSRADSAHAPALVTVWLVIGLCALLAHRSAALGIQRSFVESVRTEFLEARHAALLAMPGTGVLVVRAHRVEEFNDTLLELFGCTREELLSQGLRALLVRNRDQADFASHCTALHDAAPLNYRVRYADRQGGLIELDVHLGVLPSEVETPGVIAFFSDVSERIRIEQDLRFSRDRLRLALDALESGVWDIEVEEERYFYSRRFKMVFGFAIEQRLEQADARLFFHHELIDPRDWTKVADARMQTLQQGVPFDVTYRIILLGEQRWVHETVVVLTDASGNCVRFTGAVTDITDRERARMQLTASEVAQRTFMEAANALIWRCDAAGVLSFVSERGARDLYGYSPEQMIGRHLADFSAPGAHANDLNKIFAALARGRSVNHFETVQVARSRRRVVLSINAVPVFDEDGRYAGALGSGTDVTALRKRERDLQDSTSLQRLLFENSGEGIVVVRGGLVQRCNQAFADLIHASSGEITGQPLSRWFADPALWQRTQDQLVELGLVTKMDLELRRTGQSFCWVRVTGRIAPMVDEEPLHVWLMTDISASRAFEESSWQRVHNDALTGLPNRRLMQDRLEQGLMRAQRESLRMAVMVLDLDGFRAVNESAGRSCGDAALRTIAARLGEQVRQFDSVARVGSDDFVLLVQDVGAAEDVLRMGQRLIERIAEPIAWQDQSVRVTGSVGIAIYPDCGDGLVALLHGAEEALTAARAAGGNCCRVSSQPRHQGQIQQSS